MRITCVIGTLGGGGAERVMTYLCGGLAARGHAVTLLTLDSSVPDFYVVPPTVTRVRAQLPSFRAAGVLGGFVRLYKLTRAVRNTRPEVVISFMTISVLASCLLLRIPYIYADHLDVRFLAYSRKWKILRNWLLRFAKTVTVLSERDRKFIALYHPGWKPAAVYNPALPCVEDGGTRPLFMVPGKKYVLAVGRLVKQKGFDRLLQAWRRVCERHNEWRLAIVGSGPDEAELKSLADTLDVQYSVDFVPAQKSLAAVYRHADILAMSSRAEGFPLVLLEAMAAGLPAVSFACTGPDVIIRNNLDGFLVKQNQTELLAARLEELMQDEQKRRQFGARAREVTARFSLQQYLDAYENLCKNARS